MEIGLDLDFESIIKQAKHEEAAIARQKAASKSWNPFARPPPPPKKTLDSEALNKIITSTVACIKSIGINYAMHQGEKMLNQGPLSVTGSLYPLALFRLWTQEYAYHYNALLDMSRGGGQPVEYFGGIVMDFAWVLMKDPRLNPYCDKIKVLEETFNQAKILLPNWVPKGDGGNPLSTIASGLDESINWLRHRQPANSPTIMPQDELQRLRSRRASIQNNPRLLIDVLNRDSLGRAFGEEPASNQRRVRRGNSRHHGYLEF
ncbi:Protein of unknown function [Pyronema omphalodes CBS 100304]|uniref:Uncharacterized protein n=1 Tax=Pyronema omphalodes (strain CBS 100304) TaxID=1076935 RepID=U4L3L6_PYROM|nr:Protein of unknown function [Pyronema omphalodes CBS 100304]